MPVPVPTYVVPTPVSVEAIRTHVRGPKPCNTLAFIRCKGLGKAHRTLFPDDYARYKLRFTTEFEIHGFAPANHEWYRENTLVSASAVITKLNVSPDCAFTFAFESIAADVDHKGRIVFETQIMTDALADGYASLDATIFVSAYVLLFEPRPEPPPPGGFGRRLALAPITYFPSEERSLVYTDDPRLLRQPPE